MGAIELVKKYPYVTAGVGIGVLLLIVNGGGKSGGVKADPRLLLQSIKQQEATKRRAIAADVHKTSLLVGSQNLIARMQNSTAVKTLKSQSQIALRQINTQSAVANKSIDYAHQEFGANLKATLDTLPQTYKQQLALAEIDKKKAAVVAKYQSKAGIIAAQGQANYLNTKGDQGWLDSIGGLVGSVGGLLGGLF